MKTLDDKKVLASSGYQKTLRKSVKFQGKGLFTGAESAISLSPAPEGSGVLFKRVDLPGKPIIPAHVNYVYKTPRCTILGNGNGIIQSVEHLLSALKAFSIDNVLIEIDSAEVPVGDGSALPFVELLEEAQWVEQGKDKKAFTLTEPLYWSEKDVHLVAIPSDELRFSYTLSYPKHPLLHSQFFTFLLDSDKYVEEIAPCRTFSLYEEILPLLEKGVIKGGTLNNGVIIKGNEIVNPDGLRFPDEMVRHKVLDLIGDLSLIGYPVIAHFIAIRSGHYSNTELAKRIEGMIPKELENGGK